MQIKLFDKIVGDGQPVFVIAEVGLNHNGSMEIAKQLIDAAKAAGCDAVKFQKRHVPSLAVRSFLDAPDLRFPAFGSTYREVRQAVEFSTSQLMELRDYSRSKAIPFFVTPFELNSAKEIDALEPEVI
ncbi:MAG TPA: N-acetylneuraminate synthase family protein, partial [Leptospiraceae bacterium]|nr:N-acetylneuraminate synthase family protein [Leptospiraceae bacterium]